MIGTQHLTEELRSRGYRITPQRTAILAYLHDTPGIFLLLKSTNTCGKPPPV